VRDVAAINTGLRAHALPRAGSRLGKTGWGVGAPPAAASMKRRNPYLMVNRGPDGGGQGRG
jgi:hypothetical protein